MAAVCNSFAKSWPYVHAQLVASRDEPPAAPPAPPLTTTPPLDAPPPDPPSEVQQVLDVDASLLEEQEEEEPPPQRGWFGRFVGNAVSATKHYGGRAAELGGTAALTVGSAVGETVLTVRDKLARDEMHSGGGAAGASAPESAEAAPGADAEANPQIKGLFNRVADGGDHASAAEVSERLGWGVRGLAQRSAHVVGAVASTTKHVATDLRQKVAVTAHNTRARLGAADGVESTTHTFKSRFDSHGGAAALGNLEASSLKQLEHMRALQAELPAEQRGAVDSAFMLLHSTLDLPMEIDGEAFSEPADPLVATSAAASGAVKALDEAAERYVKDLGTLTMHYSRRVQTLQQQAVAAAAEAEADSGEQAARDETGAAQQVRLAVYARRAVVNSATDTLDKFSDLSLHSLGELSALGAKALVELELEFGRAAHGPAQEEAGVLETLVPARAGAVRLVAHSVVSQLKRMRAEFGAAVVQVCTEAKDLCAHPFDEDDTESGLAPLDAKSSEFSTGLEVDLGSAAGLMQDGVQYMLPIIKALTLEAMQPAPIAPSADPVPAEAALASEPPLPAQPAQPAQPAPLVDVPPPPSGDATPAQPLVDIPSPPSGDATPAQPLVDIPSPPSGDATPAQPSPPVTESLI